MRIRRCAVVLLEPRETVFYTLDSLLQGGNGLQHVMEWFALAPHLDAPVAVTEDQRRLLGELSPSHWTDRSHFDQETLEGLIDQGLVLDERAPDASFAQNDERLRESHWHPLAAVLHAFTRWDGVDAVKNTRDSGTETAVAMRRVLGPAPPEVQRTVDNDALIGLPSMPRNDFDDLLGRRVTCRNFDRNKAVPFQMFSHMLQRVFAAHAQVKVGDDLVFLKKNVPSGGGLHPIEAYILVRCVEGLPAGVYHYRADVHALELVAGVECSDDFVMQAVGQQHWFADAHVLIALVPRFDRTFWKYRQHAKGYRVVALEAGHLSQTLYLAATDLGLGAFITGAVNEKHLERALGLDPVSQGVLAVCGFGWRAQTMVTTELDPAGAIWNGASDSDQLNQQ
ncbi:putative peptide maturation dehydrogenase [Xanthomonas arboricola]|uniref:putative peptide maturation dehydrogenase n=1 Tax=Xanthomonas arboricola TaxID=56448 RepID=UPI0016150BF5|nr:putative peptide maturation dehydrogenase [Xanthomonas arboricola]MBB6336141.1 putative peptide maturation dehydrogenase [Xanthomonas arboricola]